MFKFEVKYANYFHTKNDLVKLTVVDIWGLALLLDTVVTLIRLKSAILHYVFEKGATEARIRTV